MNGCPNRKSFIPGPTSVLPSLTRGGSRMRESRTYGSVRGALSNERPYRDRSVPACCAAGTALTRLCPPYEILRHSIRDPVPGRLDDRLPERRIGGEFLRQLLRR